MGLCNTAHDPVKFTEWWTSNNKSKCHYFKPSCTLGWAGVYIFTDSYTVGSCRQSTFTGCRPGHCCPREPQGLLAACQLETTCLPDTNGRKGLNPTASVIKQWRKSIKVHFRLPCCVVGSQCLLTACLCIHITGATHIYRPEQLQIFISRIQIYRQVDIWIHTHWGVLWSTGLCTGLLVPPAGYLLGTRMRQFILEYM